MEPKTVAKFESKFEEALIQVIMSMGLKQLPLLPAHHTVKMMAKAAVAVYETAVDCQTRNRSAE